MSRRLGLATVGCFALILISGCAGNQPRTGLWLRSGADGVPVLHFRPCPDEKIVRVAIPGEKPGPSLLWVIENSAGSALTEIPLDQHDVPPGFKRTAWNGELNVDVEYVLVVTTNQRRNLRLHFAEVDAVSGRSVWDRGVTETPSPYAQVNEAGRGCSKAPRATP